MNRRRFLELLGSAALGSGIVYSFPSVIVPKNISTTLMPLFWSDQLTFKVIDTPYYEFGFSGFVAGVDYSTHLTVEAAIKRVNDAFHRPVKSYQEAKLGYANELLEVYKFV